MSVPVRRQRQGGMLERRLPGWGRDPLSEFDDLFSRMGALLESAVGGGLTPAEQLGWAPPAEITETDDAYMIECELPGLKRDDIDVELNERELHITGELKEPERKGIMRRGTRRYGRFDYRALLPGEVNTNEVKATLNDGVLTVTVPKAQASKPRHVEITMGD